MRSTRRKWPRRALLAIGVIAVFGAVAGSSALAAGEEIVVHTSPITELDPAAAVFNSSQLYLYPTCLKLVNYDEDLDTPVAEAAVAMPTVTNGGLTYTFDIASGQAFSNGELVTAASFERAIERATSPSMPVGPARTQARALMQDIAGAQDFYGDSTSSIAGLTASGSELSISLTTPVADFPARLSTGFFCATHSAAPAGVSATPLPAAGPYYISSASGTEIVLARNPNYGGTRTQNLGTICVRPFDSPGDVDYVANPSAAPAGLDLIESSTTGIEMLFLNTTTAPFSAEDVRRSAGYAINRTALSALYTVPLAPTDTFLSPLIQGAVDHDVYPLDGSGSATALALLGGQTPSVTLCYPGSVSRDASSAAVEAQLEAVGFVVTRNSYPGGTFFNTIVPNPSSGCHILLFSGSPSYPDPAAVLPVLFDGDPAGGLNRSFFNDPTFNARFDAARAIANEGARLAEYADLDRDLAEAAPNVAVGFTSRRDYVSDRIGCLSLSRARFGGFALNRLCIEVTETAAPGETISTGGDATTASPLQTSLTVPSGGDVAITQGQSDASELPAFKLLEQQVDITAPAQTPPAFLTLTFEIDAAALVDAGLTVDTVTIYRNLVPVPPCPGDPCVASRTTDGEGDGVIVVHTSQASQWNFGGYVMTGPFQPVDPQPTVNTAKAGQKVPVTFSLGGDVGLDVFADGYPKSEGGPCAGGTTDAIETTSNAAGLTYDAATATYTYHWKTLKAWAGDCRTLTVVFADGSEFQADFRFR